LDAGEITDIEGRVMGGDWRFGRVPQAALSEQPKEIGDAEN